MSKSANQNYPDPGYDESDRELLEQVAERDDEIGSLATRVLEEVEFE